MSLFLVCGQYQSAFELFVIKQNPDEKNICFKLCSSVILFLFRILMNSEN